MQIDKNARRRETAIVSLLAILILLTAVLSWKYISGKNIDLGKLVPESTDNVVSGDEADLSTRLCRENHSEPVCLTALSMTGRPITKITTTTSENGKSIVEVKEINGDSLKSTTLTNGIQTKSTIKLSSTLYTQNGSEKAPWSASAAPSDLNPDLFLTKPVEILDFNKILNGVNELTFTESTIGRCSNQECIKFLVSTASQTPDESKLTVWINTETFQIVEIIDESSNTAKVKHEFVYPQTISILRPDFVTPTQ